MGTIVNSHVTVVNRDMVGEWGHLLICEMRYAILYVIPIAWRKVGRKCREQTGSMSPAIMACPSSVIFEFTEGG